MVTVLDYSSDAKEQMDLASKEHFPLFFSRPRGMEKGWSLASWRGERRANHLDDALLSRCSKDCPALASCPHRSCIHWQDVFQTSSLSHSGTCLHTPLWGLSGFLISQMPGLWKHHLPHHSSPPPHTHPCPQPMQGFWVLAPKRDKVSPCYA